MVRTILATLAISLSLPGAGGAQLPRSSDRPPDGLLERPALQALVDLQVRRDGAALATRLEDPEPRVRARAAFALASVQDPDAVPALLELLEDADPEVRADAAFAIGQTAGSTVGDALLGALEREPDSTVRRRLMEALGKTGDRASLSRLAGLRVAASERDALALALGRYGLRGIHHGSAVERLVSLLEVPDPSVRRSAAYYFGHLEDPAPWADRAPAVRSALDAAYPFQFGGPEATAPGRSAPEGHLVAAVGRLDDPDDTLRLIDWLQDAVDWRTRVAAARSLAGRTSDDRVRSALLEALGDPSTHVGVAAGRALSAAESLPGQLVHELAQIVIRPSPESRVVDAILPALARGGVDGLVITRLMRLDAAPGDHPYSRAAALRALGEGSSRGGFLVLEDEAGWEDPRVAAAALDGLAKRWRRGVVEGVATEERYHGAFVAGLERGDVATIAAVASVLADPAFRRRGSVEALERGYRRLSSPGDLEAMTAILGALGEAGDPSALDLMDEALAHPHPVIRRAAASAQEGITGRTVAVRGGPDPADREVDWERLARLGPRPRLVLETERGRLVIVMDPEQAPLTVQTIAGFAEDGRYDGVPFHRVVPNFVIQGGDFARADGRGGPGFAIRSEFTRIPYARGIIGMASAGKDTEGSQFFATHSMQPRLDGRYTAFGVIVEGRDVLDAIRVGDRVVRAEVTPTTPGS